jgi:hypothetical protein
MSSILTRGVIRNGRVEVAQPINLPDGSEVMITTQSETPGEVAARIQATTPNSPQVRLATANLAELLRTSPHDPGFEPESWKREWAAIDAEMKAMTRANSIAEGRGS